MRKSKLIALNQDEKIHALQEEIADKEILLDLYRRNYHDLLTRVDALTTTIQKKLDARDRNVSSGSAQSGRRTGR